MGSYYQYTTPRLAYYTVEAMKRKQFRQKVFDVVRRIPSGQTMAYGEVAKKLGAPGAARAVGAALKTNFDPQIPCHRVIRSDGKLGGYNRGVKLKKAILEREKAARPEKMTALDK